MIFYLIIKFSQILDVSVTIYLYMKDNTSQQTISFWILLKCYIVESIQLHIAINWSRICNT